MNREMPWAIIEVKKRRFAIATEHLQQIVPLPPIAAVPGLPSFVRGVINLRGRVIPLVDLRLRLGMTSVVEEVESLCKLLQDREQDHRRWLAELRNSLVERRAFGLATDPHKCAFGKWYDSYRSEDAWVNGLLSKFDAPHKKLHASAAHVKELQEQGKYEEAGEFINGAGASILSTMIDLFAELKTIIRESRRETVLALNVSGRLLAITVDSTVAVEKLQVEDLPAGALTEENAVVQRLGRIANRDEMALIVEPERILDSRAIDGIVQHL